MFFNLMQSKSSKPVAMVFGASRGIGRSIALALCVDYNVVVLAKSSGVSNLPGTVETVLQEIQDLGGSGKAVKCDVRSSSDIQSAINSTIGEFGRIDAVVYNAGAIKWDPVGKTSLKQYELMHQVNVRGFYCVVQHVLPLFEAQGSGKFLVVSPPIYSRFFKGKTPYAMTKVALTVLALGLATELPKGISISALWPAKAIKTYVTDRLNIPDKLLRRPEIFSDCVVCILKCPSEEVNGRALLDEDFLRSLGHQDFEKYRCDPTSEPPRMMPANFPDLRVSEEFITAKL
jgi:NAD(P)-dependent dehydrogenase (short-subunit alcohol dehydrogenase family)